MHAHPFWNLVMTVLIVIRLYVYKNYYDLPENCKANLHKFCLAKVHALWHNVSVSAAMQTLLHICFAGAPTLVRFDSLNVSDSDVMITWTFNDMGVPVSSFNLTINCDGQPPFSYDVSVPPMGNQVTSTRPLANYPADTSCTVTVGASNLLGSSNDLTNVFMTPATGAWCIVGTTVSTVN